MRVGLLTGGGDAPGLNGIIESVVRSLALAGHEVVGICDGFEGVFEGRVRSLTPNDVHLIHATAGTLLGTSNRVGTRGREAEFYAAYRRLVLDGLIVAGGDGTFAGLSPFVTETTEWGPPIQLVGVPKTLDNDLRGTDLTFGYDTACSVVAEAVDGLRLTAEAHRRLIVVEAMGRTAGWIALGGGLASHADAILIPERPYSLDALTRFVEGRRQVGQRGLVVVVAEGAAAQSESVAVARQVDTGPAVAGGPDPFGVNRGPEAQRLGGIAARLAGRLEEATGWESRVVVLGHLQRARAPTTTDRFLTTAMGVEAARMVVESAFSQAVVYRSGSVTRAPISDLIGEPRRVGPDHPWIRAAEALGIFV